MTEEQERYLSDLFEELYRRIDELTKKVETLEDDRRRSATDL